MGLPTDPKDLPPMCGDCKFWVEDYSTDDAATSGRCRRNAPPPGRKEVSEPARWPTTEFDDWCGEFARRGPPPAAGG